MYKYLYFSWEWVGGSGEKGVGRMSGEMGVGRKKLGEGVRIWAWGDGSGEVEVGKLEWGDGSIEK